MVEFSSISRGIYAADQMVKVSDAELATATSVCPGKYIAIVHGDVADVEESVQIGEEVGDAFVVDSILIPNVHPGVFPAIVGATVPEDIEALGILVHSLSAIMRPRTSSIMADLRAGVWPARPRHKSYYTGVAWSTTVTTQESPVPGSSQLKSSVPAEELLDNLLPEGGRTRGL